MGSKKGRVHPPSLKAKVAIEAIRGIQTMSQISGAFGIHTSVAERWKRNAIARMPELFVGPGDPAAADKDKLIASLYQEIGRLKMELDWLEKKVG